MVNPIMRILLCLMTIGLFANCESETAAPTTLADIAADQIRTLPCLQGTVDVAFTELGVPHVYGENDEDVACAMGFVVAVDRYFEMEMAARLGLGEIAGLIGELGIEIDVESRTVGMTELADRLLANTNAQNRKLMDAYAAGVNVYVNAAKQGEFPAPGEYDIVAPLGGHESSEAALTLWDARRVAAVGAVVEYQAGFNLDELRMSDAFAEISAAVAGLPFANQRVSAAVEDLGKGTEPIHKIRSSPTIVDEESSVPSQQATSALEGFLRTGPGVGSNAWAMGPTMTSDASTILASDGHLNMTVPTFFYQMHINTTQQGEGDLDFIGMALPGLPFMGPGTNGKVAWSQTQLFADLADWYEEELVLDDGVPVATIFQGEEKKLVAITEDYNNGTFGVESYVRYKTHDGRIIFRIEGDDTKAGKKGAVNVAGQWIRPRDLDKDGKITAISLVQSAHFEQDLLNRLSQFPKANTVDDMIQQFRHVVSYSGVLTLADKQGGIANIGWHAQPCRGYLPKDANGVPLEGANQRRLLDGTKYPSWVIPIDGKGNIIENSSNEQECIVPLSDFPYSLNPDQDWVFNANNEIQDSNFDGNIWNSEPYIGGPWAHGFRAQRISDLLEAERGSHSIASNQRVQADKRDNIAAYFYTKVLALVDEGSLDAAGNDALKRLSEWNARGLRIDPGVDTFYNIATDETKQNAIAASIWNAWLYKLSDALLADENLPEGLYAYSHNNLIFTVLDQILAPAKDQESDTVGWDVEQQQSIYWDDTNTPVTETASEIVTASLTAALDWLATPENGREGGFGSSDPNDWLWGKKHYVRFESLLTAAGGDDVAALFADFGINPEGLPVTSAESDLNRLSGFPRGGGLNTVDAANFKLGEDWSFVSGPVMRLIVWFGPDDQVEIHNILPAGQSGFSDSEHFDDQVKLWLANETIQIPFRYNDVVAQTSRRWTLNPATK